MFKNIKNIIEFKNIKNILLDVYREYDIPGKFSKIFNTNFKIDKAGRLYAIIHPTDFGDLIYNYDINSTNINNFVSKMIMDRIMACETVTQGANIFDMLVLDIQLIDEKNNIYLIIFKPYNFDDFEKSRIKIIKKSIIYILLGIIVGIGIILI